MLTAALQSLTGSCDSAQTHDPLTTSGSEQHSTVTPASLAAPVPSSPGVDLASTAADRNTSYNLSDTVTSLQSSPAVDAGRSPSVSSPFSEGMDFEFTFGPIDLSSKNGRGAAEPELSWDTMLSTTNWDDLIPHIPDVVHVPVPEVVLDHAPSSLISNDLIASLLQALAKVSRIL